jgi:succinylarginine dihydrolase
MSDEGAANHTRLSAAPGRQGLHLFVYGRTATGTAREAPRRFPARQTLESVQAIARRHRLPAGHAFMIQQDPAAIDAGVFHNDVICVGHLHVLIHHERAFAGGSSSLEGLARAYADLYGTPLTRIEVPQARVSLEESVRTYLFNSQVLDLPGGKVLLAVPSDCLEDGPVPDLLSEWVEDTGNPVGEIVSFNLRESMRNGGGPACLRQRMVLSDEEAGLLDGRILLDQSLYRDLVAWVEKHYRDHLEPADLADPQLLEESRAALDELTGILRLPGLYPFQN